MKNLIALSAVLLSVPAMASQSKVAEITSRYRALAEQSCGDALSTIVSINVSVGKYATDTTLELKAEEAKPQPDQAIIAAKKAELAKLAEIGATFNAIYLESCVYGDKKLTIEQQGQQTEVTCAQVHNLILAQEFEAGSNIAQLQIAQKQNANDAELLKKIDAALQSITESVIAQAESYGNACVNVSAKVTLPEAKE